VNALEIESEIAILKNTRTPLVLRRTECMDELSKLNFRIRTGGHMPDNDYKKVCLQQQKLKDEMRALDAKLAPIKLRLQELGNLIHRGHEAKRALNDDHRVQDEDRAALLKRVDDLRRKYREFAADHTRVSSMRLMATTFADELQAIIKANT
jgi:hypothetical protein